jgi:hypothetical protein
VVVALSDLSERSAAAAQHLIGRPAVGCWGIRASFG